MTLNPQEQETIVGEHSKELFGDHIGQLLFFCCLIMYLFSLESKNVVMIGGQMLFTTWNTSVDKVWIFYGRHFYYVAKVLEMCYLYHYKLFLDTFREFD